MYAESHQLSLLAILGQQKDEELDPSIVLLGDERWEKAIAAWQDPRCKAFGIDIETCGAVDGDGLNPLKGQIRLIQIGLLGRLSPTSKSRETIVVDLGYEAQDRKRIHNQLEEFGFWKLLGEKLEDPNVFKVGQNLSFEQSWFLNKFGFKMRGIRDVLLMSQVYWAGLTEPLQYALNSASDTKGIKPHSLGGIALRLGLPCDKSSQKSDFGWGDFENGKLSNKQLNYAARDAQLVIDIWRTLGERVVTENLQSTIMAECAASPAFAEMEFYGMPVCLTTLEEILGKYLEVRKIVYEPFRQTFGDDITPDQKEKLKAAVADKLKILLDDTSAESLSNYWDVPELKALSLYRTLTTYINYLLAIKRFYRDGAVRGRYNQINPSGFGRSTCKEPNLQNPPNPGNLPKELKGYNLPPVREIFKPPVGKKLIVADLSQAHARIGVEASQDPVLVKAYNTGADVHCITASKLAQIQGKGSDWTPENITKWRKDSNHPNAATATKLRNVSKNVFYGSLNMQEWRTLQDTIRTGTGENISEEEAKQAIQAWRETYSGLYQFQRRIARLANSVTHTFRQWGVEGLFGEVRGLSGRRIFFRKRISKFKPDTPEVKATDACAFYWASTEADIMKAAMGGLLEEFDEHPEWEAHFANMAHDEIDVVCKEEFALEVASAIQAYMKAAMMFFIKSIPVDDGASAESMICSSWADK